MQRDAIDYITKIKATLICNVVRPNGHIENSAAIFRAQTGDLRLGENSVWTPWMPPKPTTKLGLN